MGRIVVFNTSGSLFQRGGTAVAIERSANSSDLVVFWGFSDGRVHSE